MATLSSPDCALDRLTDKEREILRLLAAGHTVKSIAAQLARSEASVNERLREARRKSGVGSSRELARLLAQKNRDEKFDLTAVAAPAEEADQPPHTGRKGSKGRLMTIIALPVAVAGLLLFSAQPPSGTTPAGQLSAPAKTSPLEGKWALDTAKIPDEERPQSVTIAFRQLPDQKWAIHVEIVAPDSSRQVSDSEVATDGVPVPISGNMGFIDTVSLRQPEPNALVMTLGKGGTPVSTRVYTVAKDHKSMKETIVWAAAAEPRMVTTYFSRID